MSDIFNKDFREFIELLNQNEVEYIVAGGFAVILNGYRRPTGDVDIWVNRTGENFSKLINACNKFGLPAYELTLEKFLLSDEIDVFTFGRPPVAIDIMTRLKGVNFKDAYEQSKIFYDNKLAVRYLHVNNLIEAKTAAGRYKDLDDIEKLSKIKK